MGVAVTPGLAVLEASGLSVRRFAAITGCASSRKIIASAKPDTIAEVWLPALAAAGSPLVVRADAVISAGSVRWSCYVERL